MADISSVKLPNNSSYNIKAKKIFYADCSTAKSEIAKVVSCDGFVLETGAMIAIRFTDTTTTAPTSGNITLNINGTGDKNIVPKGSNSVYTYGWNWAFCNNQTWLFTYNGTNFVCLNQDNNTTYSPQSLGFGYGTCTTAEATTAKVATLSGYNLVTNGIVSIKFSYNVPASATLNINNKGAKAIYNRGSAITSGIILAGDIATFVYNGSQYHLIAVDNPNAQAARKLTSAHTIDGVSFNGTSGIIHYATCSTDAATAAKTVSLTGFVLATGAKIAVKFTVTNTAANPTLNVNGTGAKAIYHKGAAIATNYIVANGTYDFVYNGAQYDLVGSHPTYTARTGVPTANATPAFGGTFQVTQPTSDALGHITGMNARTITIPSAVATQSANGLMPSADKTKLDLMSGSALTSNGTTATTNKGYTYGVAGVTTSPYTYAKWYVYLDSGIKTLTNGMIIRMKIPVAGCNYGTCITIDGTNFHPVVYNTNSVFTTHLGVNSEMMLMYDSGTSANVYSNSATSAAISGVWRMMNTYDYNSDNKVAQNNSTSNSDYRLLLSYSANDTNTTNISYKSKYFQANPSTGAFYAYGYNRVSITGSTLDINTLTLSAGSPNMMHYIEKTTGGAANITNIPVTGEPFILDVELVRWASTTDYVTLQTFRSIGDKYNIYTRWCTSGTWSNWTKYSSSVATTSAAGLMSADDKKILDILKTPYVECATGQATADKTATLANFTLTMGSMVVVKFTDSGTSEPPSSECLTLNINNTGAKNIVYSTNGAISPIMGGTGLFSHGHTHIFLYQGSWLCMDWDRNDSVKNTLATTTKAYVTGTTYSATNTGTQVFDTGVYLDTTAGQLVATTFKGDLSGTAENAIKIETTDSSGNPYTGEDKEKNKVYVQWDGVKYLKLSNDYNKTAADYAASAGIVGVVNSPSSGTIATVTLGFEPSCVIAVSQSFTSSTAGGSSAVMVTGNIAQTLYHPEGTIIISRTDTGFTADFSGGTVNMFRYIAFM